MRHSQVFFGVFFSVLLVLAVSSSLDDAEAQKASGKSHLRYGQETSSLVCGDALCSEIKNDFLNMVQQSTFMIGGVAFQSFEFQNHDDNQSRQILENCLVKFDQLMEKKKRGIAMMELKKDCKGQFQNIQDNMRVNAETKQNLGSMPKPKTVIKENTVIIPEGTMIPGCESENECYSPYSIAVRVGESVTWINQDSAAHTVTSGTVTNGGPIGEDFDSGLVLSGDSFSHKFNQQATFDYFCMVHPWMQGIVIVS